MTYPWKQTKILSFYPNSPSHPIPRNKIPNQRISVDHPEMDLPQKQINRALDYSSWPAFQGLGWELYFPDLTNRKDGK